MQTSAAPSATDVTTLRNYVGGEWVESSAARTLDVLNPATAQPLARVPLGTAAEVDRAVQAAQAAFPAWRATPPLLRARYLFRLKELLEQQFDGLARAVTLEMGKTLEDARGSVRRAIENVEVACGIPSLMMGFGLEDGAAAGIDEEVVRQPLGVFAAICPFNFPAMVPFWFLPYAVACGNTFVVKPSERVPMTQNRMFELIHAAGFPPGVVNLVNGDREAVDALLDHPDVKGISFVGSTAVAKQVYARAAANGKRVQAQGGAKNMLVVMPDADYAQSVANMLGSCFGAAGQRCLAGSVIIPVGAAHEPLRVALLERASALRVGNGLDAGVEMGPVISASARDRIVGYVEKGVAEGAKLLLDGRNVHVEGHPDGYFVGPTVFDEVSPDMAIAQDEIFGPVVSIVPAADLDAALAIIARSPYGNAASIYTQSGAAAREFRYRAPAGNVGVNVGVAAPMAYFPFSGAKESFFGTLHAQGQDGIRFYTESKVVITRWF
ncbi:MAG TPA: CoA-acylating methylmalonate-semialdehyde dehydrogenase [Chloroflexota bacterium]|jgi:malonate-semialdehyde dehydrogenase (acetylating)/methylmalonate-semialdehyde dehydrogenase